MAVRTCPSCGEANSENAIQCIVCSSSLKNAPIEGTPDADKNLDQLFGAKSTHCWHCNEKVEQDALRCKYCGSTIIKPTRNEGRYYSSGGEGSPDGCAIFLLFAATFIIPLVGLIVGGIFVFNDDPGKRDLGKGLLIFGLVMIVIFSLLSYMF
ncbi:zinc ribbon domain-containing protein [Paenibacillus sp. GCM10027626]|uniref:double zinc ribbon domain-containing protein n=1 Tax=Paenibacillus sp. GCM10027626 TaxID=3273411 RepID=UPI0036299C5E